MSNGRPTYPLTITFQEDGDVWVLNNESEVANNLEWFDSRDPEEKATVTDKSKRKVTLVVEELEVKLCTLENST